MIANVGRIPIPIPNPRSESAIKEMALLSCQFNEEIPEFISDEAKIQQIASEVEKEEKNKEKEAAPMEEEEKIDTGLDQSVMLLLDYNDIIMPRKDTYNLLLQEAKQAAQAAGE